ncbi:hypothetical protein [Sulfurovum sp.]|nr:hypothetical protein [Sulfurovum sp.]
MSVRNYVEQGALKSLKIQDIAEFIVLKDIQGRILEDKKRAKQNKQH